ncbi:Fe-S protein assembly co-chaperone HscB [Piscinibacterium candidicorallinum]|uniref:Co-chaperone protein HscB homolog n=1 Tax=Piscinibacterium candidicorallinum TaxID=1793872 RepID=A0ABV7GZ84_9BURK
MNAAPSDLNDFFALFGLPRSFRVDLVQLESAYREVQARVHPDRHAAAGDAQQRVAMQWATAANEGFKTLKQPIKRAQYLLKLAGVDVQAESNTAMPPAFLMQQMEWRETLDDAVARHDQRAIFGLINTVEECRLGTINLLAAALDDCAQLQVAARLVRELMFIDKFASDVRDAEDALLTQ